MNFDIMSYIWAFIVGGALCVIAQILLDKTSLTPARILVGYVVVGVILGGLGVYKHLIALGGAGARTPLSGFGYLIAEGVRKAVDEHGLIGLLSGGLSAAATGTAAALIFGFLASLVFRGRNK
jgi:stage V sporulation protein AE